MGTALFLYQVQPMLLDTTTMESTPRPRESAGKSRFSMYQAHISHPLARLLTSTKQLVAHQAPPVLLSPILRVTTRSVSALLHDWSLHHRIERPQWTGYWYWLQAGSDRGSPSWLLPRCTHQLVPIGSC